MGSWNNGNNSYISTIDLTIPDKVSMLLIIKFKGNGFSFWFTFAANYKFISLKF